MGMRTAFGAAASLMAIASACDTKGSQTSRPDAPVAMIDAPACVDAPWATETVMPTGALLEGSMVLDPSGGVHASFAGTQTMVAYAHRPPDGGWTVEPAPRVGFPNYNALARTSDGTILIAYRNSASSGTAMRATVRDPSGTWTESPIEVGNNPAYPSLARDASDRVHLVYQTGDGSTLGYATHDPGGAWTFVEHFDTGVLADNISLDVDANDGLHVAFTDASAREIQYAHKPAAGTWAYENIDYAGGGGTGSPHSLAVDSNGVVHLAYATTFGLFYARRTQSGWQLETVDGTQGHGCEAALALAGAGDIDIVYKDCTGANGVWFARRTSDGTWTSAMLDPDASYLGPAMIGEGPADSVHAAWISTASALMYAHATICPR